MKSNFLALACLLCSTVVSAQSPYIALQGAVETADGISVSEPRTTLAVDVTVDCERIICGPYARYAQKFLGVRAPLTDKTTWTVNKAQVAIEDASTCFRATAAPAEAQQRVVSHAVGEDAFARIQPDKVDMAVPTLENAARDAANTIFSLRKHRLDLITGEAGENVFGEGLKAALAEIAALEQSYLELFLGKQVLSTQTRRYTVDLQSDKKQYIVCRFSPAAGLLPDSDLSGDMVLLQVEPSASTVSALEASAKETNVTKCRIAAPSTCTVVVSGREYARTVLPLFEFGRTVNVALPRRK